MRIYSGPIGSGSFRGFCKSCRHDRTRLSDAWEIMLMPAAS